MTEAQPLYCDTLLPSKTARSFFPKVPPRGRLVYVMGASGVGKDSLLEELRSIAPDLPLAYAVRHITRPASDGGEKHIPLSRSRFERLAAQGFFALHWASHGRLYGISSSSAAVLEQGLFLLVNGSRAAFPQALALFPDLLPVLVSAPVAVLRERLLKRGRESGEELERRLNTADMRIPGADRVADWIRIENSGSLEEAASTLEAQLRRRLPAV